MTHPLRRAAAVGVVLALAACRAGGATAPPSAPEPTPTATSDATPTAESSSAASQAPSDEATPSASSNPDGFTVAPNADADALFLDRDECENLDDGYRVEFPDAWYTNTAVGDVGPCAWFSPTFYEVDDPSQVPDEIAISIELVSGDAFSGEDSSDRVEGIVGETQSAVRVEEGGEYRYVVQLGPPGSGPTLIAKTATDMGGDYELNKAVLDRIIATMEFVGTIE